MADSIALSSCAVTALTDLYHAYEQTIEVCPAPIDKSYKALVTFDDCKNHPVHRWYSFKEGYSHRLLEELQRKKIVRRNANLRLLDPFSGVGTTLLSSQFTAQSGHIASAIGIERNPAIRFIANAKLQWRSYRPDEVASLLDKLNRVCGCEKPKYEIPGLSTLTAVRKNGKRAFEPDALQELLFYREWIETNCAGKPEYNFFLLAWTTIIEGASNTRKDGRALRLLEADETLDVKNLLLAQCRLMLADLNGLQNTSCGALAQVIGGDARRLPFSGDSFDVICYSPPYLNNIDYSEVYKLELWLRGDITSAEEFRALRLSTLRSHPSITFPATNLCDNLHGRRWIRRLKNALLAALPEDNYKKQRQALFSGYIDDLLLTLAEQYRVAMPGAPIICVVGNSLHGGKKQPQVPVCTDLLIAAAAQAVGLHIDHLQIARQLPRRDHQNGWLRETIIVMRKPTTRTT